MSRKLGYIVSALFTAALAVFVFWQAATVVTTLTNPVETVHAQPQVNCFLNGNFTATGTSSVLVNSASANMCNTWVLQVFVPSTVSAFSVQLEGSADGTFTPVIVTPVAGSPSTNPCTTLTSCTIMYQGSYNQFRVNLTSLTGSGTINYRLYGASGITAKLPTGTPVGTAGGDLSGSYPNPTVAKVNGNTPGSTCTNQFTRSIDISARGTCATVDNASLANSSVTINGSNVPLGGSITLPVGANTGQGLIYSQYGSVSISTLTQVSVMSGAHAGSATLTAGYMNTLGNTFHLRILGNFNSAAAGSTLIMSPQFGGTTVYNTTLLFPSTNVNYTFSIDENCVTVTTGGAGVGQLNCLHQGIFSNPSTGATISFGPGLATLTTDLTATRVVDFQMGNQTANPGVITVSEVLLAPF
jgi:hypothetical protein